ncbi:2OG-Fe(II) oxygenase [Bradyrhizobium sp. KB893862 SZCCT0404]|uniref:2OG-Fe(II) oxygenase n=1 Tax=Bradyrhizobium sp. KB893862 SZCCT0404 TaxID=2807672 RepID=UPI001BA52364|nr:2OG-Fe(II) oxygenase [Bradyrhizobium sp. KB893862 SZCCT0404]MBR1175253.1 2OG-Fe(II) oxygenase [Bradyrhizobium sp. KB893862 SZCCT0404]
MNSTATAASSASPLPILTSGDIAPECRLADTNGAIVHLRADSVAGCPLVLVFCPRLSTKSRELLNSFSQSLETISSSLGARVFAVAGDWDGSIKVRFPILLDPLWQAFAAFSAPRDCASIVILRRNYHLAAILTGSHETLLTDALSVLQKMTWEREAVSMRMHPPVLLVPDVLSSADCAHLMEIFETRGQTYVDPQPIQDFLNGSDFKMRIPENGREDRIDHFFFEGETLSFLNSRLNRVWPEIFKAFHYPVTKCETLRVAKYQGRRGGTTHGHRDNHPPTHYRRFAMSINLNTPEFEGGELRFPEFGDQRYRPDSGTAIVFSSSLLHEALHVTKGRRYVLLAFLFGDT